MTLPLPIGYSVIIIYRALLLVGPRSNRIYQRRISYKVLLYCTEVDISTTHINTPE